MAPEDPCKNTVGEVAGQGQECLADAEAAPEAKEEESEEAADFVRMNNQFVIPVLDNGVVQSLVVMSITLEVAPGQSAAIFAIEPKLRDELLRVLFDHANAGGFRGGYTQTDRVEDLRRALLERARKTGGGSIRDVLILDLLRQDV